MNPFHTLATLSLSIGALAFALWVALAHPAHQTVVSPYAQSASVAAAHA